jgi:hypothetical protein
MEDNLSLLRKELKIIETKKLQINTLIAEKIKSLYSEIENNNIKKVTNLFILCYQQIKKHMHYC